MAISIRAFQTIRGRVQYGSLALASVPVLLAAIVIAALALTSARRSLEQRAEDQLISLRAVKQSEIQAYFDSLRKTVQVVAHAPEVQRGIKSLTAAFNAPVMAPGFNVADARARLEKYYAGDFVQEYSKRNPGSDVDMGPILTQLPDATIALQYHYIAANPNPLGSKNNLDASPDGSAYTQAHQQLHPFMREVVTQFAFYDIFLADVETGNLVYTYFKELDFATSLLNGPYAKTQFGEAFRAARDATTPDFFYLTDYATYLPSYEDQAAFMSTPLFEGGKKIGVLLVQVPIDQINKIMTFDRKWREAGLGNSGEIYMVGPDSTPRSISRFLIEQKNDYMASLTMSGVPAELQKRIDAKNSNIGLQRMSTQGIADGLAGKTGYGVFPDYRGIPVLSAYTPINILGQKWALLAEIDAAEAFAPIAGLFRTVLYATIVTLALVLAAAAFFATRLARSINRPIGTLQSTVTKLTQGDLSARSHLPTTDELGELGAALDKLLDERVSTLAEAARESESLNHSVIEIMQAVSRLSARDLTVKVPVTPDVTGAISDALNMMTRETANVLRRVDDISNKVADASGRVRQRSESAMAVAVKGSKEIQQASDELGSAARALKEIAERAVRADTAAEEAIRSTRQALASVRETVGGISASRDLIRETEKRIKRLGERSQEITVAVNLIGTIAERTSMLALNTSMQAVAAGEAGRAYAVVADEVKRLAESARTATQQISNLVGAIQSETVDTVDAINRAITQVVEISKMAERAGEQMRTTEEKTDLLVSSVRDIAHTTEEQSKASDVLQSRAHQIQEATRLTTEQLATQAKETRNLSEYASGLLESVRVFTLPSS
ncbi:methyl-accepting chemotaxis protein [Tahibacter amnicola]|uniref:Methyl-accepting chemotaxis protein n=1 Tax=Tahibacter amnicola TaxID=2976241 RepID=A0ABY6BI01_9GAMM|nr:methyl-accepting chemotaxis protein [Tahibacter amnicola]UXI69142.1 methyl-accepting chemotaxis protein [Tahibacter amnicola]